MKNTSHCIILICLMVSFSLTGCGGDNNSTSNAPASQLVGHDLIQKYGFHIVGVPTTSSDTLPQQFTDADWGLKESMCEQAGYSLTSYAGQSVSFIKYSIAETYTLEPNFTNAPLGLMVVAKDQTSICGYLYLIDGSAAPGVLAVNDAHVK